MLANQSLPRITTTVLHVLLALTIAGPACATVDDAAPEAADRDGGRWQWSDEAQRVISTETGPSGLGDMISNQPPVSTEKKSSRFRQGTELSNVTGQFRAAGDRIVFVEGDGQGRFLGLENLALQRIAQLMMEVPEDSRWQISGMLTEYRGQNYILISYAILLQPETDPDLGF